MTNKSLSFVNPKLERREVPTQDGAKKFSLFATEAIQRHEILYIWGGSILTKKELMEHPELYRAISIQIDDDYYMVQFHDPNNVSLINHSCEPNAGMNGQIQLIAMRDIKVDEEITFDYAMAMSDEDHSVECKCGKKNCRGIITGSDWTTKELQEKYGGYFSNYLQNRLIAALFI